MSSVSKCPICLFTIKDLASPNTCLHDFCFKCLLNWSKIENTCPSCRIRFSQIHRNVNVRLRRRRFKDRSPKSTKIDVQDRFQRVETSHSFHTSSRACLDCGSSQEPHLMLNCDGCNAWYHGYCLNPPQGSPEGGSFWFCHNCQSNANPDFDASRPSSSMSNKSNKDKGCLELYGGGGGCRSDGEDSLHALGVATRSRTKYHRKLLTTAYTTPSIGSDPIESPPYPPPSRGTTAGSRRGGHRRRRNSNAHGAGRERSEYEVRVSNSSKKEAMSSTPSSHPHHPNTRSLTKRQRTGRGGNGQCSAADPEGSSRHRSNSSGGSSGKAERTQLTVHFADEEGELPVDYSQSGSGRCSPPYGYQLRRPYGYNLRRESASVSPQHPNHILPHSYHRTAGRPRKQSQRAEATGRNQREEARGQSPQPPYHTRAAAAAELRSLSPYLEAPSKGSSSSSSSSSAQHGPVNPNTTWHFDLPKNAHGHSRLTAKLKALDAEVRMSQACARDGHEKDGQKQGPGTKTATSGIGAQDYHSSSCLPQSNQASPSGQDASGSSPAPSSPSNRVTTRSSSSLITTRTLLALP